MKGGGEEGDQGEVGGGREERQGENTQGGRRREWNTYLSFLKCTEGSREEVMSSMAAVNFASCRHFNWSSVFFFMDCKTEVTSFNLLRATCWLFNSFM